MNKKIDQNLNLFFAISAIAFKFEAN